MSQTTKTISFTDELDQELNELVNFLNQTKIDGKISKSKIIRIAVLEFLDKQKKIRKILQEASEVNKTSEELLTEYGYV